MGNITLKEIPITNFVINKPNNFIQTSTDPDVLKEGMHLEKKKFENFI